MNLTFAMPTLMRRAALAAAAAGALLGTSCTLFPPPAAGPDGPPFAPEGPHRYGHNGTQSPSYQDPRQSSPPPPPTREIKRDPNNTDVNVEPPPPRRDKKENRDNPETRDTPPDRNPSSDTPPPPSDPTPVTPPPAKPSAVEDLPYGIPVVGKPGMVYSPYAEDRGPVDVKDMKRGTRVKCPFTKKHFRVP